MLSVYINSKKYRKNSWKNYPSEDVFETQTAGNWSVLGKYLCAITLFLYLSSGVCYWPFCEMVLNGLMQYRTSYSLIQKWLLNKCPRSESSIAPFLCSANIWSNKLCISDVKAPLNTGTVPQKHPAPSEKVEVSLHDAPQCFWICSSQGQTPQYVDLPHMLADQKRFSRDKSRARAEEPFIYL